MTNYSSTPKELKSKDSTNRGLPFFLVKWTKASIRGGSSTQSKIN